ncbi:hypothetical protein ACFYXS_17290 [Streptomyces sp. NPDC002574]|uniref:hypothetical protein n=1 Tax=Streptomyces sp. NPDC002574 TaxID=3364652 RepID=UPI0036B8E1B4
MAQPSTSRADADDGALRIEEYDCLVLLRSAADHTLAGDIGDLVSVLRSARDRTVTLVSNPRAGAEPDFWPRLSGLLDSLRASGRTAVRLVMDGAGEDRPDRPALARHIADAWGVTVEAPVAAVLVVAGGSLYAPVGPDRRGGWRGFAPGAPPVALGARFPRPVWATALDAVPGRTPGGYVVEHIPAGLFLRPAGAAGTAPGDLYHAVPVDPQRLTVVVGGVPGSEALAADVAGLLSALPGQVRDSVRLVPGGPQDLLPLGRQVAGRLGGAVEVATGLPLLTGGPSGGARDTRSVVIGAHGAPGWLPFVDAALCHPVLTTSRGTEEPAPTLLGCASPLPGSAPTWDGAVRLSDRWQVTVTRAGLWVGVYGAVRPGPGLAVAPEGPVIEAGVPGEPVDESVWPVLDRLLGSLPRQLCANAALLVHGPSPDGVRVLHDLEARHGLRVFPPTTSGRGALPEGPPAGAPAPRDVPAGLAGPVAPLPKAPPLAPVRGTAVPGTAPAGPVLRGETVPSVVPAVAASQVAPPGREVVPYAHSAGTVPAPGVSPGPRTTADPAAAPDLAAVWEHLVQGREEIAAPREPLVPDPPAGPDLDVAWEHLSSRRPAPAAGPQEGQTPSPAATRPDGPEPARQASVRSPLRSGHRSSAAERAALRLLAGPEWERHAPAVARALTRLPASADEEREAAEADLTALRLHLDGAGGLLDHRALAGACYGRDDRLLPFAACLVSALRRLPTHRGAVLRGAGSALPREEDPETDPLRPGTVLRDGAPLSGVPVVGGSAGWPRGPRYAIWSVTGRLARRLFDDPGQLGEDEVLFAPGTPFMILDVRRSGPSPVVLLRELPASGGTPASTAGKDAQAEWGDADRAALAELDEVLRGRTAPPGTGGWPERCAGPVGDGP